MNKKLFFNIILAIIFLVIPFSLEAADEGIVPCGTPPNNIPCTLCHFFLMFQRILEWGISIVFILATVGIVISGILYIISTGDPGMMQKAKGYLKLCIAGVAIVFMAWLAVNTIMWILGATSIEGTWTSDPAWSGGWYVIKECL